MAKKPERIEAVHVAVGAKIRLLREVLGRSQEELAGTVGLERSSVANIEAGRQRMDLGAVETFARALGTTPKNLLKGIWL